jgi:hypothetical protein
MASELASGALSIAPLVPQGKEQHLFRRLLIDPPSTRLPLGVFKWLCLLISLSEAQACAESNLLTSTNVLS